MKHVHAEVIKVLLDDCMNQVEQRNSFSGVWELLPKGHSTLVFVLMSPEYQFRIKPQPKAISWTNMYANGGAGWSHRERLEAENEASDRGNRVGLVEVRDDGTAHLHKVEA